MMDLFKALKVQSQVCDQSQPVTIDDPLHREDSILGPHPDGLDRALPGSKAGITIPRSARIDVPLFEGVDLENWLFLLDLYFEWHVIPTDYRIAIAGLHMVGPALTWYRGMSRKGKLLNWRCFTSYIRQRFGPSTFEDFKGQLSKLSQVGTVSEFITAFEATAEHVPDIEESMLISMFISGLTSEIRRELLLARPNNLFFAFELARAQEAKFDDLRCVLHSVGESVRPHSNLTQTQRAMSSNEVEVRKAQGLCYHCDEKWFKGHKCKHKFNILMVPSDLSEDSETATA